MTITKVTKKEVSHQFQRNVSHLLFVEGKDEKAIVDPLVLEILLKDIISVKPMGASYQ